MKYLGNYKPWIKQEWIDKTLSQPGQARPRDWSPMNDVERQEYNKYQLSGYDLSAINWWVYEEKDLGLTIDPPWCKGTIHWWITKLLPGQFMPMHTDPHTHDLDCLRFWIPLQDYEPGHVFVYNDQVMTGYLAGDVYSYIKSTDLHGAANIGHSPRLVLQVTEYAK